MNRIERWYEAMDAVIAEHEQMPLVWGKSDCVQFPLAVAAAITGTDSPAKGVKYSSERGAMMALKRRKFASIGDGFASVFREAPLLTMQRGDIGVCNIGGIEYGCIVVSSGLLVKSGDGLSHVRPEMLTRLFKVGD